MKKILTATTALIICFLFSANAQNAAKGKEILNGMSKKYKSYSSVKADFKYILEVQSEKFKEDQKGTFFLKGQKFKLDMGDQTVICDGKLIWTYLKDANEVQINRYDPKSMNISPTEIFTMYEKGFMYGYTGDEGTNQVVELSPTDKKVNYFKVKIYVDKAKSQISKSKIYEKNGNIFTYEILNQTPNFPMADNFFSFDKTKYPKVTVTDLTK
jgi:outer membrane lipoprotein carrier protein